jgi:hypothetical protein
MRDKKDGVDDEKPNHFAVDGIFALIWAVRTVWQIIEVDEQCVIVQLTIQWRLIPLQDEVCANTKKLNWLLKCALRILSAEQQLEIDRLWENELLILREVELFISDFRFRSDLPRNRYRRGVDFDHTAIDFVFHLITINRESQRDPLDQLVFPRVLHIDGRMILIQFSEWYWLLTLFRELFISTIRQQLFFHAWIAGKHEKNQGNFWNVSAWIGVLKYVFLHRMNERYCRTHVIMGRTFCCSISLNDKTLEFPSTGLSSLRSHRVIAR